jgi:hypothetical protein
VFELGCDYLGRVDRMVERAVAALLLPDMAREPGIVPAPLVGD